MSKRYCSWTASPFPSFPQSQTIRKRESNSSTPKFEAGKLRGLSYRSQVRLMTGTQSTPSTVCMDVLFVKCFQPRRSRLLT